MNDVRLIEAQARVICDGKFGAGHFDKPTTKRGHWRRVASEKLGSLPLPLSPAQSAWRKFCQWLGVAA